MSINASVNTVTHIHDQTTVYHSTPATTEDQSEQLYIQAEPEYNLEWCYMQPKPRPCFTFALMKDFKRLYNETIENNISRAHKIRYQVLASSTPNIFSLGGDLEILKNLIETQDKTTLTDYAHTCIDAIYARATMYRKGITQISLVQGDALGGGFEGALAAEVLIAEKGVKFGFPDILFNSFPGIGAYTFLSRKIGVSMTEKIILSGKIYSAEELYDIGVIDILVDKGQGEMAVYNYISKENRSENAIQSLRKIRDLHDPLKYEQLLEVADLWVDNATKLTSRDLRMIDRLISKQKSITSNIAA